MDVVCEGGFVDENTKAGTSHRSRMLSSFTGLQIFILKAFAFSTRLKLCEVASSVVLLIDYLIMLPRSTNQSSSTHRPRSFIGLFSEEAARAAKLCDLCEFSLFAVESGGVTG